MKFRTRAAAKAAVDQSPIEHAGQWLHVEFLDLTRQSKCVEYNRAQERALMRDEPMVEAVRPMFQFYSNLPANRLHLNPGETGKFVTKVSNASGIDQELMEIDILPKKREFHPLIRRSHFPARLKPDESYPVHIEFRPGAKTRVGFHRLTIKFKFRGCQAPVQGSVDVNVFDEEDYAALAEPCAASDDRGSATVDEPFPLLVVPAFPQGCRDGAANRIFVENQLEQRFREARPSSAEYRVPENLQQDVNQYDRSTSLNPWRTLDTYRELMHNLLYLEEAAQRKALARFNVSNAELTRIPTKFGPAGEAIHALELEGLSESRPSVMPGDRILVCNPESESAEVAYEGHVWAVRQQAIEVIFARQFESFGRWQVRLGSDETSDRRRWKHMHCAIDECPEWLLRMMSGAQFPDQSVAGEVPPTKIVARACSEFKLSYKSLGKTALCQCGLVRSQHVKMFTPTITAEDDELLEGDLPEILDDEQRAASQMILRECQGDGPRWPILLHGPFGSGKTLTLCEATKQVVLNRTDGHVLLCAETNSAADRLCEELAAMLNPTQMLRLNAPTRNQPSSKVLEYSNWTEGCTVFDVPSLLELKSKRVVVTTASASGFLAALGLGTGHFSHIFVDESAQMLEPMCLIPLSLAAPTTVIVLCGDEQQIGPRVLSQSAATHGLHKTLMQRLGRHIEYAGGVCSSLVHRLRCNYRTNPQILELQSRMFYDSTLKAMGPADRVGCLDDWQMLPKPGTPFMFVAVEGENERECESPSWFNKAEAWAIKELVDDLHHTRGIDQSQMAVISSYKLQVAKIRRLLRQRGLGAVDVGLPDSLQGKQKKVVLLSFVRTSEQALHYDKEADVGLHLNAKRLNSAMTRCEALLVIVGHPELLSVQELPVTRNLLAVSKELGCYIEMAELSQRRLAARELAEACTELPIDQICEPQPGRLPSGDAEEWMSLYGEHLFYRGMGELPCLTVHCSASSIAIDISLFGACSTIDLVAPGMLRLRLQPDFRNAVFVVPARETPNGVELLVSSPSNGTIRFEQRDLLLRVSIDLHRHNPLHVQTFDQQIQPVPGRLQTSTRSPALAFLPPVSASVASLAAVPSSLPAAGLRQCWYGYYCNKGIRCELGHTPDEQAFFESIGNGACPRAYKMRLCTRTNCQYETNPAWCTFAHGEQDFWCMRCWQSGHSSAGCSRQ